MYNICDYVLFLTTQGRGLPPLSSHFLSSVQLEWNADRMKVRGTLRWPEREVKPNSGVTRSHSPLSLKAGLTDTSSCHVMAVTMETRAAQEAAGVSVRPVRAGLLTPGTKRQWLKLCMWHLSEFHVMQVRTWFHSISLLLSTYTVKCKKKNFINLTKSICLISHQNV